MLRSRKVRLARAPLSLRDSLNCQKHSGKCSSIDILDVPQARRTGSNVHTSPAVDIRPGSGAQPGVVHRVGILQVMSGPSSRPGKLVAGLTENNELVLELCAKCTHSHGFDAGICRMDSTRSKSKVCLIPFAHKEVFLHQSGWVAGQRSLCTSA